MLTFISRKHKRLHHFLLQSKLQAGSFQPLEAVGSCWLQDLQGCGGGWRRGLEAAVVGADVKKDPGQEVQRLASVLLAKPWLFRDVTGGRMSFHSRRRSKWEILGGISFFFSLYVGVYLIRRGRRHSLVL